MELDSETTKAALEAAKPFLEQIANPPLQEMGHMFQDRVRLWCFNQQLSFIGKAKKKAEKYNIPLKAIPFKILAPMLEGASLEEDSDLQEMWANLLVNYADSRQCLETSVFPYMLSQLSGQEARVINEIWKDWEYRDDKNFINSHTLHYTNLRGWLNESERRNLIRLGILEEIPKIEVKESHYHPGFELQREKFNHSDFEFTSLGKNFLKACLEIKKENQTD